LCDDVDDFNEEALKTKHATFELEEVEQLT
jgi:hypothetical protein